MGKSQVSDNDKTGILTLDGLIHIGTSKHSTREVVQMAQQHKVIIYKSPG